MISKRRHIGLVVLAIVPLLLTLSCDDTDFINPGNYTVAFETGTTNAATTSFNCVFFTFEALTLRPVDPLSDEAIDGDPIAITLGTPNVDFDPAPCPDVPATPSDRGTLPGVVISAGQYFIESLQLRNLRLIDTSDPANTRECIGLRDVANDYPDPLIVNVTSTGSNAVSFVLNVDDAAALMPQGFAVDCNFSIWPEITDLLEVRLP